MKLFSVGHVGVFLESLGHRMEKRKSGEVKVHVLGCTVRPFTKQLATALDDAVRTSLFQSTGNADPRTHVRALEFHLPIERQDIEVWATPDSEKASFLLDQVKIEKLKARVDKDTNAYALKFHAVVSCDAKQAAKVEDWLYGQRFLTFSLSAPDLDLIDTPAEDDEDDDDEAQPELDGVEPARRISRRKTNGSGAHV